MGPLTFVSGDLLPRIDPGAFVDSIALQWGR